MTTITAKDPLPGSISGSIVETGGHSGNTKVSGELIIQDSITGNITVLGGGKLVIKGSLTGDVINQGSVELASGGTLEGNFDNSGQYQLDGTHNGETMNLLAGSMTKITGQGVIDIFSQKGAQMSVAPSAKLSRSSGNAGRTMSNDGALNISGSSVEDSLTNTGSVVVTGSGSLIFDGTAIQNEPIKNISSNNALSGFEIDKFIENMSFAELMKKDINFKIRALLKVRGLSEDDLMAIINNPDIDLRDDMTDIILTIDNTTNEMTRLGQRIEWTALNNTYRVINSDIQDCFDQANTATDILREIKFNKKWDVITPGLNSEVSGMGHAWGKIYSEDGSFITFDPRSCSFGVNRVCDSCHGWFGL